MILIVMRRNELWALKMYLGVMDLSKEKKKKEKSYELGAVMPVSPPLLAEVGFQIWLSCSS